MSPTNWKQIDELLNDDFVFSGTMKGGEDPIGSA